MVKYRQNGKPEERLKMYWSCAVSTDGKASLKRRHDELSCDVSTEWKASWKKRLWKKIRSIMGSRESKSHSLFLG